MKLLLMIGGLLCASLCYGQKYSKVKIFTDSRGLQNLAELGLPVDHGTYKKNTFLITDLSESQIEVLQNTGYAYEILVEDLKKRFLAQESTYSAKNETCAGSGSAAFDPQVPANFDVMPTYGGYYTYAQMLAELDAMAAQYPNLITVKAPIHTYQTWEGRPIYHVKISDNPAVDDGEEKVLYTAIHHAREPMSMSQTIFFMWYLLENYGTNPEVTYLVDNTQMFFVPCINPDGYIHNEVEDPNGGGMHRKNKNPSVGSTNPGVDLNRNYSYGWNTTGVSANENNDTYPGTSAFSEPETQAIQWLVEYHNIRSAFNAHTYGNTLLHPVGTTEAEFADHHDYFTALTGHMVMHNGYFPQKSSGLYPASGDSDDYMYKVDIGVGEKDTIFAMTPEIGTDFWPASGDIIPTCKDMVFSNLVLSHMVHKYYVVAEDDPSTVATLSGNFHHTVQRLGLEDGSVEVSIQPLLNIQSVGAGVTYDLGIMGTDDGLISYQLDPAIQFGDEIRYVLESDYGIWVRRDTITKTYGAITEQLVDNANSSANWTGNWATTGSTYYSASQSFTESPSGNYQNDADRSYQLTQSIDLTNATAAMVSFYARWEIEADYDYCQFQVSTDGGNSWIGQCGLHTVEGTSANGSAQPDEEPVWEGVQTSWVLEEISLSDYLGEEIVVRFRFESDGGVREDGFYFDDFIVAYNADASSAGVDDQSKNEIGLYPNPSNGVFSITGLKTGAFVEIIDMNGKLLHQQTAKGDVLNVSLTNQSAGTYVVYVTQNGVKKELKLVIKE